LPEPPAVVSPLLRDAVHIPFENMLSIGTFEESDCERWNETARFFGASRRRHDDVAAAHSCAAVAKNVANRRTPTPASFSLRIAAFLDGLKELGHVEGKTIAIEWRWGQDRLELLPGLAAELVQSNVDVIVTGRSRCC
jgi:hypothetical protein